MIGQTLDDIKSIFELQQNRVLDFRYRSKADIEARPSDVRFTPKSGHQAMTQACPLCASGHMQCSN